MVDLLARKKCFLCHLPPLCICAGPLSLVSSLFCFEILVATAFCPLLLQTAGRMDVEPFDPIRVKLIEHPWHWRETSDRGEAVWAVDAHPFLSRVATAGGDGFVKIWQIKADILRAASMGHGARPEEMCGFVAALANDRLSTDKGTVNCVRWSPGGSLLCSVHDGGVILIWRHDPNNSVSAQYEDVRGFNKEHWACVWRHQYSDIDLTDVAWGPDSKNIVVAAADNSVLLFGTENLVSHHTLHNAHDGSCCGIAWDPWNEVICSSGLDRRLCFYHFNPAKGKHSATLAFFGTKIGGSNASTEKKSVRFLGEEASPHNRRMSWSPDGLLLAVPCGKHQDVAAATHSGPTGSDDAAARLSGATLRCLYIFLRNELSKPAIALGGIDELTVIRGCRWAPCLFKQTAGTPQPMAATKEAEFDVSPPGQEHAVEQQHPPLPPAAAAGGAAAGDPSLSADRALPIGAGGPLSEADEAAAGRVAGCAAAPPTAVEAFSKEGEANQQQGWGPDEYRMALAAWTAENVLVYTTNSAQRLCGLKGLHYGPITDCSFSSDASFLFVTSEDGYVTACVFHQPIGELFPLFSLDSSASAALGPVAAYVRTRVTVTRTAAAQHEAHLLESRQERQVVHGAVVKKKRRLETEGGGDDGGDNKQKEDSNGAAAGAAPKVVADAAMLETLLGE